MAAGEANRGPRWLAAAMGARLAEVLRKKFGNANEIPPILSQSCSFLIRKWEECKTIDAAASREPEETAAPLSRLTNRLSLSTFDRDLLIFAGLPEEHEGYADVLRTLHPEGKPRSTLGLTAQVLCDGDRTAFRERIETGPLTTSGALRMTNDEPFFDRSLKLADGVWSALHGVDTWPSSFTVASPPHIVAGLEDWLNTDVAIRARRILDGAADGVVLVTANESDTAADRALALVAAQDHLGVHCTFKQPACDSDVRLACIHAIIRGVVPVLCIPVADGAGQPALPSLTGVPGPVFVAARDGAFDLTRSRQRLVHVFCERLSRGAGERMWSALLPGLARQAPVLAARYPMEPAAAYAVSQDVEEVERLEGRKAGLRDVADCARSRRGVSLAAGARMIHPKMGWEHLVLPPDTLLQLKEAVDRLQFQNRVLEEWQFLKGRRGANGVRLLLSGPPGTGKTLTAEVLASALDVDLLVVDLSRIVSKWIGETEKNLSNVFAVAEDTRCVLLFDEADALFGKRTEISDAHDRYANLETAYLLARLEQFDGLAVLSTNLRQSIDGAFLRRLEFLIEFREPDRSHRLALWRKHLPAEAPLANDVNLDELAGFYPIVGGLIRNAATAAAFLAAKEGTSISRDHFLCAIRREYVKAGKSFPGTPVQMHTG